LFYIQNLVQESPQRWKNMHDWCVFGREHVNEYSFRVLISCSLNAS
jgi:hypothetical protein